MVDHVAQRSVQLTDPRALRAVAHPVRLALISQLRRRGPLTATQASELVGESPSSCSFHLRQLAKYGLVEEAGGGRGRERPWRATSQITDWPAISEVPGFAPAAQLLETVIAERYFQRLMHWLERRSGEPPEWQEAAAFGDQGLYLTADELAELARGLYALGERFFPRTSNPELRPKGARRVGFLQLAFPDVEDE
jgi:DNA-binding transcriptional ArsR family regulator